MAAIKRDAADLLGGDTSKKIKIVTSEQEDSVKPQLNSLPSRILKKLFHPKIDSQDAGTMYIIQNTDELEQEEGITLEGEDSSQYITTEDSNLQLAFSEQIATSGAVQIVTSDGETEKHYITADGQILSSADDISSELITAEDESHLVINDDGQQVMLEESVQPLEINNEDHLGGLHEVSLEQEAVTELEDQGDKVKVVHKTGSGLLSRVVGDREELVDQYQNLIIQHMDISEPLSTLRKLLEQRLGTTLAQHEFYLQDVIPLEPSKNLTSQCVQGSGMVQINVEVKSQPGLKPRLNIVDILKPAEEVVEMQQQAAPPPPVPATKKVVIPFPEESENVTRWIVDQNFRREQERLKIPFDPVQWNEAHVRHWIQWAVAEFALSHVDIDNFVMNGRQLCELRHEDFVRYIPSDKGDIFWTHLELLRKCKFVATIQQPTPHAITTITVSSTDPHFAGKIKQYTQAKAKPRTVSVPHTQRITSGNRTGNNGQIQLWQFLLELLTDKDYMEIIHWVADDGEFKLNNPEVVAQLWGQRKNKPTMNYEKLSRALRYYYDGDMIAKVHGKRFVYKFVCDLRNLLGYSAAELKRQVTECAEKNLINVHEMSTHRRVVHHQPQRPIILHTK